MSTYLNELFGLKGRTVIVLGGSGVLCSRMALGLSKAGADKVVVTSRTLAKAQQKAKELQQLGGGTIIGMQCDVMSRDQLNAFKAALGQQGISEVHCLINGAGGNNPKAIVPPDKTLLDADLSGFEQVFVDNFFGTHYAVQVLLPLLIKAREASVINIGSMSGDTPLTRVAAYSAAKAAVHNYTKWLAVELAKKEKQYGGVVRVNCIAPGFFPAEQNKALMFDPNKSAEPFPGNLTSRGQSIIGNTPMGRFGEADDLVGTTILLASPASRFVTGAIIPVDGGFSSFTL